MSKLCAHLADAKIFCANTPPVPKLWFRTEFFKLLNFTEFSVISIVVYSTFYVLNLPIYSNSVSDEKNMNESWGWRYTIHMWFYNRIYISLHSVYILSLDSINKYTCIMHMDTYSRFLHLRNETSTYKIVCVCAVCRCSCTVCDHWVALRFHLVIRISS